MAGKQYRGTTEEFESKLARVMARLGVDEDHYQSNWSSGKGGASCWVEMQYAGSVYRFENSTEKSRQCGRNLVWVSDLFGAVVYALEGLARAVEQGIFTLDMLLSGALALPAAPEVEPCFAALGFDRRPATAEEVKTQYRRMAQVMHPDKGGDEGAFVALNENYQKCLELMEVPQ